MCEKEKGTGSEGTLRSTEHHRDTPVQNNGPFLLLLTRKITEFLCIIMNSVFYLPSCEMNYDVYTQLRTFP